ncbi:hypothetical protein M5K25_025607 [Dendrobium thyrsiflorum]|uniref:Uncharacterized protein n=1 Tax=Dendrobium thyrsiflorum TaxID=117978 RepID=A0ABD0U4I3_DENTH
MQSFLARRFARADSRESWRKIRSERDTEIVRGAGEIREYRPVDKVFVNPGLGVSEGERIDRCGVRSAAAVNAGGHLARQIPARNWP